MMKPIVLAPFFVLATVLAAAATTPIDTAADAGVVTLTGTVRDSTTGKPVTQARVELLATRAAVVTDAAGAFTFETAGGAIELAVSHPGYQVTRLSLAAAPAGPITVRLDPVISVADRIEVTAARAREGTDPATFTNLSQEKVAQSYWGQDPAIMLSQTVPGFFAYNDSGNGIGYSYYWIRGFNQAQTRMTLNGVPLNDASDGELYFIDLADFLATAGDIQVQRGVFGLSGIGGAVDITTAPPSLTPAFSVTTGYGSYNTKRFETRWDSGLINGEWAATARYSKISTDGYRDQSWVDMWNYYFCLAHFGDRSRVRLVLFGGPEQTHLAYDGVPKSVLDGGLTDSADRDRRFNPLTYPGEQDNFTQPHVQIIHDLALSEHTQLSETFFYFTGSGYYTEHKTDEPLSFYNLPDITLPGGTVITNTDLVRHRQIDEWDAGWVPTLTTTDGAWTLSLRGELRLHSGHSFGSVQWAQYYPPDVPPDHRYYDYKLGKRSADLLATVTWKASDALSLTAGLEAAQKRYDLNHDVLTGVDFTQSYDFLLPRFGAVLRLNDAADLYANVARGEHEPAFRTLYDPEGEYSTERTYLRPEDVWDWEAGVSIRHRSWRARANVFFMNFVNEIVYSGALDSSGVPIYGNGAHSHHEGLELDASADPLPALGFDGTLTLSHNTFVAYHDYNGDGSVNVYDGNVLGGYPDLLASLTARLKLGAAQLALTGRYVGRFYLDNTQDNRRNPQLRQAPGYVPLVNPGYAVVDASLRTPLPRALARSLGCKRLALDLRLNNALNRFYTAFGYIGDDGAPLFIPAATRNVYVGLTMGL
jgi:iron complex outermembrane receptor protein